VLAIVIVLDTRQQLDPALDRFSVLSALPSKGIAAGLARDHGEVRPCARSRHLLSAYCSPTSA
jgi:hypothetical protein